MQSVPLFFRFSAFYLFCKFVLDILLLLHEGEEVDDDNTLLASDDSLASCSNSTCLHLNNLFMFSVVESFPAWIFIIEYLYTIEQSSNFAIAFYNSICDEFKKFGNKLCCDLSAKL